MVASECCNQAAQQVLEERAATEPQAGTSRRAGESHTLNGLPLPSFYGQGSPSTGVVEGQL